MRRGTCTTGSEQGCEVTRAIYLIPTKSPPQFYDSRDVDYREEAHHVSVDIPSSSKQHCRQCDLRFFLFDRGSDGVGDDKGRKKRISKII